MTRRLGTAGQLYINWDPSDTTHLDRRAFLGVTRQLSLHQAPEAGTLLGAQFENVEELFSKRMLGFAPELSYDGQDVRELELDTFRGCPRKQIRRSLPNL